MRVEEVNVYKFEELSEEAKHNAIERWRNNDDLQVEGEMLLESFEERLHELGYEDVDVEFSLSHSQGDGVAFYGTVHEVDVEKIAKRLLSEEQIQLFEKYQEDLALQVHIKRNSYGHHYSHYNTMYIDIELGQEPEDVAMYELDYEDDDYEDYSENEDYVSLVTSLEKMIDDLEEAVSGDIKEISKELEREGYDYFEEIQSDEAISETLIANEYEFMEDGKMW